MIGMTNMNAMRLYDSETAEQLSTDDLEMTEEQYETAIRESYAAGTPEGHIRLANGRRVYAK